MKNIGIVGYGNMGKHLAKLLCLNNSNNFLTITDKTNSINNIDDIDTANNIDYTNIKDNIQVSDILFLTVKPKDIKNVCEQINIHTQNGIQSTKIIVSVAAGVSVETIKNWTNNNHVVTRCMPNILISETNGAIVWLHDPLCYFENIKLLHDVTSGPLSLVVKDEKMIDAATVLSGSNPAFIASIYDSYLKSGIDMGFNKVEAELLVRQSMEGTLEMLKTVSSDELVKIVSSKGGVTEVGLDEAKFDKVVMKSNKKALDFIYSKQ